MNTLKKNKTKFLLVVIGIVSKKGSEKTSAIFHSIKNDSSKPIINMSKKSDKMFPETDMTIKFIRKKSKKQFYSLIEREGNTSEDFAIGFANTEIKAKEIAINKLFKKMKARGFTEYNIVEH